MSINKLKSIVRRGTMFGAVFAVVAAALAPASLSFADALNPLTQRSLTLSSSSPGWDFKDGSGNDTYSPPNSGANGKQTGNTFAFKVSSTSTPTSLKAITFQYCTQSAGFCQAPGNIESTGGSGTNAANVANKKSDLEIVTNGTQSEISTLSTYVKTTSGIGSGQVTAIPARASAGDNFVVYYQSAGVSTPTDPSDDAWTISSGWDMTATNEESTDVSVTPSGKANQINLVNTTGTGFAAGTPVKVVFFATDGNYITNPGAGAFFVKINTWNDASARADSNIIDGGVTVANVMNQSIEIQTKVLETMDFSVGTVDPNTLSSGASGQLKSSSVALTAHQVCGRILTGMTPADSVNTLKMGNPTGEFSLATEHTYSTHSYWRLSSNSSAGATVYYSGNTLSNTVGDKIEAIGAVKDTPAPGSEQFGLAIDASKTAPVGSVGYQTNYQTENQTGKVYEYGADDAATGLVALNPVSGTGSTGTGVDATMLSDPAGSNASYHAPQLYPLKATDNYDSGAGNVNSDYGTVGTQFAFDETSQRIPVPIATEDSQVVDCVTAKMRYIANIAATTPAGIYTTKINYIAAPQY